ncbi:MAG: peptidoglycan DD-metalloendopeptidase family protein [bacterium]|nr:peptidoglycan DD-metalloendopeptidase family protein [bacterium]
MVKLTFVSVFILTPSDSHAGVFSYISNLTHNKEADAREIPYSSGTLGVLEANLGPGSTSPVGGGEISIVDGSALIQEVGVVGTQADIMDSKSTRISLYVVRQGDSLSVIAKMFGVSVNTIVWANNIRGPIHEGDELVILPISGVSHKVIKGDTVRSIATKYKADIDDILNYNDLKLNSVLETGSVVLVPDGEIQLAPLVTATSRLRNAGGPLYPGYYLRPIDGGRKTQGLHGYNGIDIGAPTGTPVYASAGGVVLLARSYGYNGGYGQYIVVSHANGTQTLYAHLSRVLISSGEVVLKGQTIGLVGSSGKSTGSHIHFEIRGAANVF